MKEEYKYSLGEILKFRDASCSGIGKLVAYTRDSSLKYLIESESITELLMSNWTPIPGHMNYNPNKVRVFSAGELERPRSTEVVLEDWKECTINIRMFENIGDWIYSENHTSDDQPVILARPNRIKKLIVVDPIGGIVINK